MKKIMLIGSTGCGKTTLCQRLTGQEERYKKTQAIEVVGGAAIDTPGEYLDRKGLFTALIVTAVEADLVLFLQAADDSRFLFAPGQCGAFSVPAVGVVTKTDLASPEAARQAEELLKLAGAGQVFRVSARTGQGMEELKAFLEQEDPLP